MKTTDLQVCKNSHLKHEERHKKNMNISIKELKRHQSYCVEVIG